MRIAAKQPTIVTFPAGDVAHLDVSNNRWKLPGVAFFIKEVDRHDGFRNLPDGYVPHVDALHYAAADGVCLDAKRSVQARAVHAAAFRENVARAAGNLAADGDAAMAVFHRAIAHDHVFNSDAHSAAVIVSARLERE